MTKRPIEWTDEEMATAWDEGTGFFGAYEGRIRILRALGAVHPHEAREREREAWRSGFVSGDAFRDPVGALQESKWRVNSAYPSLLPKSQPPLVLSTGTWTRYANKMWGVTNPEQVSMYERPVFRTATDARKLAEWLAEYGDDNERK